MKRFETKHLAAFSLITILPFSVGCHISGIFDSGEPGSGISATETRPVDDFDVISMAGQGDLNIQFGDETTLIVTADDNLLELLETVTEDDRLEIRFTESVSPVIRPVFDVSTNSLSKIQIAGSSNVTVLDFDGDDLSLELAGSGTFKVIGVCKTLELSIAGSGRADLSELVAKDVEIDIAGSGSAKVHATHNLDVDVAGSGSIRYLGEPKISKTILGSGAVRKMAVKRESSQNKEIEVEASPSDQEEGSDDDEEDE